VLFAIDIDGTIAGASSIFGAYFNQELRLGLSPEEEQKIRWYDSLRKHSAVVEYRKKNNERFLEVCIRYREYFPAMLAREVLAGAVEGVTALAKWGDVQYITIRVSRDTEVNEQIQAATRQWLRKYNFPNPDNVAFCTSFQEKLQLLAEQPLYPIILIDDRSSSDLLTCYENLMQNPECHELVHLIHERITFVAFGKEELPEKTLGLRMLAFPSWEHSAIPLSLLQTVK
jgi:hypothetical protein